MRRFIFAVVLIIPTCALCAEEKWQSDFSLISCQVVSSYGFFNSYSVAPSVGDKIEIDLAALMRKGAMFNFEPLRKQAGPDPYIPCPGSFRREKRAVDAQMKYLAQRFISSSASPPHHSVTFDLSSGAHFAPDALRASILVEGDVVQGVTFLDCHVVH